MYAWSKVTQHFRTCSGAPEDMLTTLAPLKAIFFLLSEEKCATLRMFEDELTERRLAFAHGILTLIQRHNYEARRPGPLCCATRREKAKLTARLYFTAGQRTSEGACGKCSKMLHGKIPFLSPSRCGCELVASLAGGPRQLTVYVLWGFLNKALVQNDPRGYTGAEKVLQVLVWWALCPVIVGWLSRNGKKLSFLKHSLGLLGINCSIQTTFWNIAQVLRVFSGETVAIGTLFVPQWPCALRKKSNSTISTLHEIHLLD